MVHRLLGRSCLESRPSTRLESSLILEVRIRFCYVRRGFLVKVAIISEMVSSRLVLLFPMVIFCSFFCNKRSSQAELRSASAGSFTVVWLLPLWLHSLGNARFCQGGFEILILAGNFHATYTVGTGTWLAGCSFRSSAIFSFDGSVSHVHIFG